MLNLIQAFIGRIRDEEGQTFVEYGLVLGGISVARPGFAGVAIAVEAMLDTDIIPALEA